MRRQGSACTGTSLPAFVDLPIGSPALPPTPPSSSPPSPVVPYSLLLARPIIFHPQCYNNSKRMYITQAMTSYKSTNLEFLMSSRDG
jgi:hypothetical protein